MFDIQPKDIIIFCAGLPVAFLVSRYFWKRGLGKKQIVYAMKVEDLIFHKANLPNEVQITYDGLPIKVLTKVLVYIWNAGNQPIETVDLLTDDRLRIVWPSDFEVFSSLVRFQSRGANKFFLSDFEDDDPDNTDTHITFSYLNVRDGAVLEIIGTRKTVQPLKSPKGFCTVVGEIIGAEATPLHQDYDVSVKRNHVPMFVFGVMICATLSWVTYGKISTTDFRWWDLIPIAVLLCGITAAALMAIYGASTWWTGYRVPMRLSVMKNRPLSLRERAKIYIS